MKNGLTLNVGVAMVMIVSLSINTAFIGGPIYARNITAYIHFNEQAIKEDKGGGDLDDMWWTVDGKNYSSTYTDMDDAVYGSDPEIEDDLFTDGHTKELMVADNASEICLEERSETPDYRICSNIRFKACPECNEINTDLTELHFSYPASWQPEEDDD